MTGKVSTANRGGFIQIRRKLNKINLKNFRFVEITAKGNNQNYYVHLRTTGTILPWQYYQSGFNVNNEFKVFRLPLDTFKKSSDSKTAAKCRSTMFDDVWWKRLGTFQFW